MRYFQCDLIEEGGERFKSPMKTTAWIEERGARVGASVEIKEYGKRFFVDKVYNTPFDAKELAEKQARDRNCFGSIL